MALDGNRAILNLSMRDIEMLDSWFDKAMDELDEELARGEITPEEHRRLARELAEDFKNYDKEERR